MGLETLVDWPTMDGKYRAVQFIVDNKPYLRFSNNQHVSIVRQFAREINVETRAVWPKALDFLPKEDRFRMPGMGWCDLKTDDGKRTAEFYGYSRDYTFIGGIIGIDEKHLDLIRPLFLDIDISYNASR